MDPGLSDEDTAAPVASLLVGLPRYPLAPARAPLETLLARALEFPSARAIAAPFLDALALRGRGARAVVLYGSCLWSPVRAPSSCPDFFVIVDSLSAWYRRAMPVLAGALLPPNVHRLRAGALDAKVSVLTCAQLARHTSPAAPDLHHLGRFSKRVALVWASDPGARALVADAQRAALVTLAPLALARFSGAVAVDEFMLALLRLSYEAEVRIVEEHKVAALFAVERAHYREVGRALLAGLGAVPEGDGSWFRIAGARACSAAEVERRLRRSRRRALLRWPKYLLTFDRWLDYLLAKLSRAGHPVTLTRRQRRYPLIFGLPILWRLARAKRLR